MRYGYARVSSKGQALYGNSLDEQIDKLADAGVCKCYADVFTGAKSDRPELEKLKAVVRKGDMVIVCKLDRLSRSVKQGIEILEYFRSKGVTVNILNMGIIDDSVTGQLLSTVLLAFAEFERNMIAERTTEGKSVARQREGYREGRKPFDSTSCKFKDEVVSVNLGLKTVEQSCKEICISRSTWYKYARCFK